MTEKKQAIAICWLRRDLRLEDHAALYHALNSGLPVLPVFIFDTDILNKLPNKKDKRIVFIHQQLQEIQEKLKAVHSSLWIEKGSPLAVFQHLLQKFAIQKVFVNEDYEPYARSRDSAIEAFLKEHQIDFYTFKDQVIFAKSELMKGDGSPYTVFSPYAKLWKQRLTAMELPYYPSEKLSHHFLQTTPFPFPSVEEIGFESLQFTVPLLQVSPAVLSAYEQNRNTPSLEGTSYASIQLRFGTVSIRRLVELAKRYSASYLNELIWREFFMMILYQFPQVKDHNFKKKYDQLQWRNQEQEFERWCQGKTGYPMVDAGMRQLNETGWMHNRVRMIVAGFLCKHLLIDWRWGEAYFAEKLLDYELSSNNGNWQWAAGTGCDAAPYFRIFNPSTQLKKFDPKLLYVRQWIPEFDQPDYPAEMVDHAYARQRALKVYEESLRK